MCKWQHALSLTSVEFDALSIKVYIVDHKISLYYFSME